MHEGNFMSEHDTQILNLGELMSIAEVILDDQLASTTLNSLLVSFHTLLNPDLGTC